MLEAKNLSFHVGDRVLLEDFSMQFNQGKIYTLVGHNGSGKSTLVKLLARHLSANSGTLQLNHSAFDNYSEKAFARQIAYLPQHLPATDSLSVRDLVGFGRYPWHGLLGRITVDDRAIIDRAMTLTDTQRFAERLVDTLSGGERQRVWLAMLLAQNTPYLLLDEPLAALDIGHQIEMLQLIRQLVDELKLGVIVVIHDINLAARFSDEIVALHSGKLIASGDAATVFTPQTLQQIYGLEMRISNHPAGYPVAMPC
uniref:ABC transporter ATP-binding protein n=1 Tax=Thaumasiovibrio occultus TaxID=1891184 RepID=UPI000B3502D0|nr:ABC transporter ATP-binding protein [Thaumasiovibrio occultus]